MKKIYLSFVIFIYILLSACNSKADKTTQSSIKDGIYVMEQEENDETNELLLPCIRITEEQIVFTYNLLSSYIGTYSIQDGKLTMTTTDNKFTYVFLIDGDSLIFQKDESSLVQILDERLGAQVEDNSIFRLKEDVYKIS